MNICYGIEVNALEVLKLGGGVNEPIKKIRAGNFLKNNYDDFINQRRF